MAPDGGHHRLEVVGGDRVVAGEPGPGLRRGEERGGAARRDAELHRRGHARRAREVDGVAEHVRGRADRAHPRPALDDRRGIEHRLDPGPGEVARVEARGMP